MSKRHSLGKKVAAYVCMPLLFWIVIVAMLAGIYLRFLHPYVKPIAGMFFTGAGSVSEQLELDSIYEGPVWVKEGTVHASKVAIPDLGTKYGEIRCEAIGLQADLYFGETEEILKHGAGQSLRSLQPGFGYPTLISAHNNKDFNVLKNLEIGDIFVIHTAYGTYEYRVNETEIIQPEQFDESLLLEEKPSLILYTCYPFDGLGYIYRRFFVYAEQISGPTVVFESEGGAQ